MYGSETINTPKHETDVSWRNMSALGMVQNQGFPYTWWLTSVVLDDTDRFYNHWLTLSFISLLCPFVGHYRLFLIGLLVAMIRASVLLVLVMARCCIGFRHFGMPKLYSRQPPNPFPVVTKVGTLSTSLGFSANVERDDLRNVAIIGKFIHLLTPPSTTQLIWYLQQRTLITGKLHLWTLWSANLVHFETTKTLLPWTTTTRNENVVSPFLPRTLP